ncbi:MAG: hypothetical protein WCP89_04080 [archaeon]
MKKESVLLVFFVLLFVVSISMLVLVNSQITGHATSIGTTSNVTLINSLSIDLSTNLAEGIMFGKLSSTGTYNNNATHNYDGVSNVSTMFVNVSADSSVNVDLCLNANQSLISEGGDIIDIGNETWANSSINTLEDPALGERRAFTLSGVKTGVDVAKGSSNYYRFWLDIPLGQKAGTYSNNVTFEGVATGESCAV